MMHMYNHYNIQYQPQHALQTACVSKAPSGLTLPNHLEDGLCNRSDEEVSEESQLIETEIDTPRCTIIPDSGEGGRFALLLVNSLPGETFNLYFNTLPISLSNGSESQSNAASLRFLHFIVPKHNMTQCITAEVPIFVERCGPGGSIFQRSQITSFRYTDLPLRSHRHSVNSYFWEHGIDKFSEMPFSNSITPSIKTEETFCNSHMSMTQDSLSHEAAMQLLGSNELTASERRRSCPVLPTFDGSADLYASSLPLSSEMGRDFSLQDNDFTMPFLQNRARLHMPQSLDEACRGWDTLEWQAKRRLIRFYRYQNENVINTAFEAVPQSQVDTSRAIVSCIFWEDKNECFVTSVDTIYLLEALVNIRFNVEEKNRIRRNLEGFRPLTVTKGHPESGEFFKLIMSFPHPKPRNIEKDIKVFPWRILGHALRKIINKYSASYTDL